MLQEEREASLAAVAGQQRLWSDHAAERHDVHDPEWQPCSASASSGNPGIWCDHHHPWYAPASLLHLLYTCPIHLPSELDHMHEGSVRRDC